MCTSGWALLISEMHFFTDERGSENVTLPTFAAVNTVSGVIQPRMATLYFPNWRMVQRCTRFWSLGSLLVSMLLFFVQGLEVEAGF